MNKSTEKFLKKYQACTQTELDVFFKKACQSGLLDDIRYLLTSPDLKIHADISVNDYSGFRYACLMGHLDVVEYLLTSPELTEHADIHADNDCAFISACSNGHLEVVSYLLTSPELTEHADIHALNDAGFIWAYRNTKLDVVTYLLAFNGDQCINFQCTKANIDWAIEKQYDDVIVAMMQNLKNNDPFQFLACLPKIEMYNPELYAHVKNLEMNVCSINSSVPELFI